MKDILKMITIIILFLAAYTIRFARIQTQNKDEQIKQLEQSLNEQLQEKEVYMRMLEERGE